MLLERETASGPFATDDGLITAAGYERLRSELERLRTAARPELAAHVQAAREDSDPGNPALYELLEEQAQLERRIALLEARLAAARVVDPAADGTAGIGSLVQVRHVDSGEVAEYELVGAFESDIGNGRLSVGSPIGRALVGARSDDTREVETPGGTRVVEVLRVRAPRRAREAA